MKGETQLLSARAVRRLDVVVIAWVVVWVVLGVLMWHDIAAQAKVGSDLVKVGSAVQGTGDALAAVGGLPLVGGTIGSLADTVTKLGVEVQDSGRTSRDGIQRVAVIGGLAVGVLPAALALVLYVPFRLRWRRQRRAVAEALPRCAGDPAFEQYLARRAVDALPWDSLQALSDDPWRDVAGGHYRALADAEPQRLGLRRPDGS
jgi:hypothetical protein